MIHDDALLDAIAVLALGALPAAEAAPLAEHIATCTACRREYASLRQTADLIGYAAEPTLVEDDESAAARRKARVMDAVRSDPSQGSILAGPARNGSVVSPAAPALAAARRPEWLGYALAIAAVLVAMVSVADDASQRRSSERAQTRVAAFERQAGAAAQRADLATSRAHRLDARLALVLAPGSRHFPVPRGEVIASHDRVVFALRGLPALPKGKVYQAWTLARGATRVAPSVTFTPDSTGVAFVELPERAAALVAVALSVEPTGGSRMPTSKAKFVRPLS